MTLQEEWLHRLITLNVAKSEQRGPAPHKPLLLLCVLDMIEAHSLVDGLVRYSPELLFRFQCYWEIVLPRQRNAPNLRMPLHALGGTRDRVWECQTADGGRSSARETTSVCRLDESLWICLQDAGFRRDVRLRLIARYFTAEEQVALCARLGLPEPQSTMIAALRREAAVYAASKRQGRDARFRTEVLVGYRFTCALTGYRLTTHKENMVEAAHIHEFSRSKNDDPRNGLALTPDAHWLFDRGLWTAEPRGDDFVVRVAKGKFEDASPSGRSILDHDGRELSFVAGTTLRPDPAALAWHRDVRFLG